ncbi:putative glycosyltransferase family 15 [Leptomonas seymouri]|uniref:Putative glycosyltransferase family 15 n=1 Tax=Leptomonas seymouri TaxID=5684 RepID=A0A0N1HSY6_LEPSE|nr:putative glycosyltransferase family 15 [Leptomonas seymouri]|eukprot:KPI82761.1 putative glycosyltransferase family 15 [Leptomonas seymouri]
MHTHCDNNNMDMLMKSVEGDERGALPGEWEGAASLRRLNYSKKFKEAEVAETAASSGTQTEHQYTGTGIFLYSFQQRLCPPSLRACTQQWFLLPLLLCASAMRNTLKALCLRYPKGLFSSCYHRVRRLSWLGALLNGCTSLACDVKSFCSYLFSRVRHGCPSYLHPSPKPELPLAHCCSRYPDRSWRCASCIALGLLISLVVLLVAGQLWASLVNDQYLDMRIQLRAAYPARQVDDAVRAMKRLVPANQSLRPPLPGDLPPLSFAQAVKQRIHHYVEDLLLDVLATAHAFQQPYAVHTAEVCMTELLKILGASNYSMLDDHPIRSTEVNLATTAHDSNPKEGMITGEGMLAITRAAVLRCIHGVPTLPEPQWVSCRAHRMTIEAAFASLWNAFASASEVVEVQPKCLARSEIRIPCADAGITADSRIATAVRVPPDESSRVQYLYEHGRLGVDSDMLAKLYYHYTPALPAQAREWYNSMWDEEIDEGFDELVKRVLTQGERFRRTTAASSGDKPARPLSGVILVLSGASERSPVDRANGFMDHALPLLERNLLHAYPYYPVHVFYEATPPPMSKFMVTQQWSLTDVLRHSDVFTILHSWSPSNLTTTNREGYSFHIPAPPPVIVDSVDKLRVMREQQSDAQHWFKAVASRVPSAPYVTFENVAPFFSTLPCGVTEEDVSVWVRDKRVYQDHRRGYRQMCRFWARFVWHLPSLRIWVNSTEGRRAMTAYTDPEGPTTEDSSALPPWRYRYAYYLRLDTDSFLHDPVPCDPFVTMMRRRCAYGYNSLVVDLKSVTLNLGTAIAEWIDNRTSIRHGERAFAGVNATRSAAAVNWWGRLSDPSVRSIVTLMPAGAWKSRQLPPLPPTWPWPNVYPEHSSAALSAAEKDVLRALFFTSAVETPKSMAEVRQLAEVRRAATETPYRPLPPRFTAESKYNRMMYFNNFELGTFALKNHPLYISVTELFDNRDYDDVTGPEREAAGIDYELMQLHPGDASDVEVEYGASVYTVPVYLLRKQTDGESAVHRPSARVSDSSPPPFQCLGRRLNGHVGEDPDMNVTARDINRDWRSGYFQYRWGDAPVHTFGVEAVMQREGWGVCAFARDFGSYKHGTYTVK